MPLSIGSTNCFMARRRSHNAPMPPPITKPGFLLRAGMLAASLASPGAGLAEVHDYVVTLDASMTRMEVSARFGSPVDGITAKSNDAGEYLVDARVCGDARPIRLRNRRMMLPVDGVRCMNYTVDLTRAARHERYNSALASSNVVVSPSLWLWRPKLERDSEIRIRFVLPDGMQVAVPWQVIDRESHRFSLTRSPESADAPAVFGNFAYREIEVPGATLRVSVLRSDASNDDEFDNGFDIAAIEEWLRATATGVTLAYGRFPNPSPQVVVIPAVDPGRGDAVTYGRVIRDGGEAIELYVDQAQSLPALLDDWTATHEFSHLMLPYIEREHRWVSEGFAQYYQNVLLARTGIYDPRKAWQELYEGFERGRRSRPGLSPNAATERGLESARMKIYWSGAAIALMADVELRERSNGRETLDDVLGRLQSCCLPSQRVWGGPELFTTLDSLASFPVFTPLYRRYADTAGFPDTGPLFERLGLEVSGDRVHFVAGSELQGIRTAITQPNRAFAARHASKQRDRASTAPR